MQYTLRNVPREVDRVLRRRARQEGRSLNQVAVSALARGAGVTDVPVKQRDLSDIAGALPRDPQVEAALADQDRIDPALWAAGGGGVASAHRMPASTRTSRRA